MARIDRFRCELSCYFSCNYNISQRFGYLEVANFWIRGSLVKGNDFFSVAECDKGLFETRKQEQLFCCFKQLPLTVFIIRRQWNGFRLQMEGKIVSGSKRRETYSSWVLNNRKVWVCLLVLEKTCLSHLVIVFMKTLTFQGYFKDGDLNIHLWWRGI